MSLRGSAIYSWVERLAPYLDGTLALDDLVGGLRAEQQGMVRDLVRLLHSNGFIRDVTDDEPHTLTDAELACYEAEIAYIGFRRESPAARFQRWRECQLLIVGTAPLADAAARAAWHSGCRQVRVCDPTGDPAAREARAADLREQRERDPALDIVEIDDAALTEAAAEADVVVALSADPSVLDRTSSATRSLFPVLIAGDCAWVGPVPGELVSWRDARVRLADSGVLPPAPTTWLAGPAAGVPANTAVFLAFRYITGAHPEPVAGDIERIELETLETNSGRVLPVGRAGPPGGEPDAPGTALEQETFSRAAAALFDPLTGPLRELEEHPTQLPLRAAVATPVRHGRTGRFLGVADSFGMARHRATLVALARLAASHPASRPAYDLVTGEAAGFVEPVEVDAPYVPGVAAALDHDTALTEALLALAAHATGGMAGPALRLAVADLPEETTAAVERLALLAGSAVHLLQVDAEIPTVVAATPEHGALALAAGLAVTDAVDQAVQQATARLQCGDAAASLPPAPAAVPQPEGTVSPSPQRLTLDELRTALTGRGLRLGVVTLDGDPVLLTATPHVLRVVPL